MTDTQPEALRLAQELDAVPETGADPQTIQEAADELRRLHGELETLRMGYAAARLEIESLKAAILAEREACAKVCEAHAYGWEKNPGNNPIAGFIAASNCASDIRLRSSTSSGIYDDAGPWVRYEDHVTALKAAPAAVAGRGSLTPDEIRNLLRADATELRRLHSENETLQAGYAAARLEIESLKAQSATQQPGDCGNTPYDEGPFTLTQQPGVSYPALPDLDGTLWRAIGRHRKADTPAESSAAAKAVDTVVHTLLRAYADATCAMRTAQPAPAGEYPALPKPGHRGPEGTGSYFDSFTADQMRAYADAACAMRAAQPAGAQQPTAQTAPASQGDALSDDAVRVPLDKLHADAAYLIGRLREGSMPHARVIEIIRERIDAAKAAIRARAAQGDALDAARLDWLLLRISGAEFRRIGVHYSGNASRADVDAARKQGENHD